MDWLRNTSYGNLLGGMAFVAFILAFVSGGYLMIIVLPIGLLLVALKIGVDVYDSAQERISHYQSWLLLKNKIISVSNNKYFETIKKQLKEIDISKRPAKLGIAKLWEYLNQNPKLALKVYTIIASFHNYKLDPNKRKIKVFANIGAAKIENSFQYIFEVFERTTDRGVKHNLAETLAAISHVAPIRSLLIFIDYVQKDYSWLRTDLMKRIIYRAQDFNHDEIQRISGITQFDKVKFYLHRTKYFFGNAFDYSANQFKEDCALWLNKIVQDFFRENNTFNQREYFHSDLMNEESGVLLAIACRELENHKRAVSVLEHILWKKPDYLPAITRLVNIYEELNDSENAKNELIKARTHIASNEWGQSKLREYDLL